MSFRSGLLALTSYRSHESQSRMAAKPSPAMVGSLAGYENDAPDANFTPYFAAALSTSGR